MRALPLIVIWIKFGTSVHKYIKIGAILKKVYSPEGSSQDLIAKFHLYAEIIGKAYEGAKVQQFGNQVPIETELLKAGSYLDIHPELQFIFNSNLRLDFSLGFPLLRQSYSHFYPYLYIGLQRYFYPPKK